MVADGAPAEFGRSSGGFVNVVTKSGTNEIRGSVHGFYNERQPVADAEEPRRQHAPRRATSTARRAASPSAARWSAGQALLLHRRRRASARRRTKQTNPNRMDPRLVTFLATHRPARRERPDRAHRRRRGGARQDRLAGLGEPTWSTFRYSYTNSEQVNGTFDVDSVGALGQRHRAGLLARRHRHPDQHAVEQPAQRGARAVRQGVAAATLRRGRTSRARTGPSPTPPSSSTTTSRPTAPAGACRSSSPSSTTTTASSSPRTSRYLRGNHSLQGRRRVQRGRLVADLHRLRQRPLRLLHHQTTSSTTSTATAPAAPSCSTCSRRASAAPRSRRPARRPSARRSRPIYVQDQWQPRST